MSANLDRPPPVDELYIARGNPVEPWRPIMQGDVFRSVQVPGLDDVAALEGHELVMVLAHPCTMRAGAQLQSRIQAVPVTPHQFVEPDRWPVGHFRHLPLPELVPGEAPGHHAACLGFFGMVDSRELQLGRRVACLSEVGVLLLQQRFIFSLTRARVGLDTLGAAVSGVLEEAELLEEWNERVVSARVEQGDDRDEALADEGDRFERLLSSAHVGEEALRRQLEGRRRVAARREIGQALERRLAEVIAAQA